MVKRSLGVTRPGENVENRGDKVGPEAIVITWHILGDRLIPLAPLSLVGFYM